MKLSVPVAAGAKLFLGGGGKPPKVRTHPSTARPPALSLSTASSASPPRPPNPPPVLIDLEEKPEDNMVVNSPRKKTFHQLGEGKTKKSPLVNEESNDSTRVETPSRATLQYIPQDLLSEKLEETTEKKAFCNSYVKDLVNEATDINLKNESLQKLWPQMFIEIVRDAVIEIRDKNSYMKQCLQRISEQK
ncbi:hypothetical protein AB205_0001550 [Aquarana catesbeiana]|uniref:Uncharacterized protein n=1 Tax=Aquarana catesbeiana TaxID=8400 RepID=A0A2G9P251_AQUCT|nr:hypothetical protein AB205_0001550 [Aquarana catesbeiana]